MAPTPVAVVKEINLYPVKSMAGHSTNAAHLGWHGFDGDRKYAFVQDGNLSHFPWLTARQVPEMLHYAPYFVDQDQPHKSAIWVKAPDGAELPLESPELVQQLLAHSAKKIDGIHLLHLAIGMFDDLPISLISTATLSGLSADVGFSVGSERFRPNLVVEPLDAIDRIEDHWIGKTICFGSTENGPQVAMSLRDVRCVMVNYDRQTLKQTPELLREIAQNRQSCAGVYGSIFKPGLIRAGDPVFLV